MKAFIFICVLFISLCLINCSRVQEKRRAKKLRDILTLDESKYISREKRTIPIGHANGWHQNMQNDGPPVPNLRTTPYCDPEFSVGKREISSKVDSFPELNGFFLNEGNSDMNFIINGTKIPAHKFVLSAKSTKFADMLKDEINNNGIDLDNEPIDAFKTMLKYFYSEKFIMDNETDYLMAFEVYKLAQKYQIQRLMSLVEEKLTQMINFDNYIEMHKFAESHQMNELNKSWMSFVFVNSNAIIANDLFLNETLDIIEKILFSLNVEQRYIILTIKKILERNPELDVKRFTKLIYIFKCTVDDLMALKEMAMFEDKLLFEEIVNRFRILYQNCNDRLQRRNFNVNAFT